MVRKSLVYDILHGLVAGLFAGAIFRELLALSDPMTFAVGAVAFLLMVYFKRHEFVPARLAAGLDFPLFTDKSWLVWPAAGCFSSGTSMPLSGSRT